MDLTFFAIAIPVATAILGYLVGFWMQKWRATEARRTDIEKQRRPIYAEASNLVYAIENNRGNANGLEAAIGRLANWYPTKANYLPPSGIAAVLGLINEGTLFHIDLNNRETEALHISRELFSKSLQKAKLYFTDNEDIRWLPEDREQKE
jgi:hypothetical protein